MVFVQKNGWRRSFRPVMKAYLPGLAMRHLGDLHPGEAKTDTRDAAIIASAARTMPYALRSLQ